MIRNFIIIAAFTIYQANIFAQAEKNKIENILFENASKLGLNQNDLKNYFILSNYTDNKSKVTYVTLQQHIEKLKCNDCNKI